LPASVRRLYVAEALEVANLGGPKALRDFSYEVEDAYRKTGDIIRAIEEVKERRHRILILNGTASG